MSATLPTIDATAASCTGNGIASQTRMVGFGGPLQGAKFMDHLGWSALTPCWPVTDCHLQLNITRITSPIFFSWTRTWTTTSAGTPFRYYDTSNNGYNPTFLPVSEFCTPFYSGSPDPSDAWMLKRGRWRITVSTNISASCVSDDGSAGYALRMYVDPYRTNVSILGDRTGAHFLTAKTKFYDGRVASGSDSKTVDFLIQSDPYSRVYIRTGALMNTLGDTASISAQLNRTGV